MNLQVATMAPRSHRGIGKPTWAKSLTRVVPLAMIHAHEDLYEALTTVMRGDHVGVWLVTSNVAFGGETPFALINRGELAPVWRYVHEAWEGKPLVPRLGDT